MKVLQQRHLGQDPHVTSPLWRVGVLIVCLRHTRGWIVVLLPIASTVIDSDTTSGIPRALRFLLLLWVTLWPLLMALVSVSSRPYVVFLVLTLPHRHSAAPSRPLETETPSLLQRRHPLLLLAFLSPTSSPLHPQFASSHSRGTP
jgi:hypothetical protein